MESEELQADITHAIDTIQNVLDAANEAIHKEHLIAAVQDLSERVDDWKSLKMESFGDLLRFGTFAVVKGDSGKDNEREVSLIVPVPQSLNTFPLTWRRLSTTSTCLSVFFYAAKTSIPTSRRPNS